VSLSRTVLYDLLWSYPATRVAAALGISSGSLSKTCKLRGIPMPERGFWQRQVNGHQTHIPPLPNVDFHLPLPWEATPEIELLLARRKGHRQPDVHNEDFDVLSDETAETSAAALPMQRVSSAHSINAPNVSNAPTLLNAAELVALTREIKSIRRFCAKAMRVAQSQPGAVGAVIEGWVRAVLRECREEEAMAALVDQCSKIAQGSVRVQWWNSSSGSGIDP
jgi:hypothetical protein